MFTYKIIDNSINSDNSDLEVQFSTEAFPGQKVSVDSDALCDLVASLTEITGICARLKEKGV